jgi:hypothetical protein
LLAVFEGALSVGVFGRGVLFELELLSGEGLFGLANGDFALL